MASRASQAAESRSSRCPLCHCPIPGGPALGRRLSEGMITGCPRAHGSRNAARRRPMGVHEPGSARLPLRSLLSNRLLTTKGAPSVIGQATSLETVVVVHLSTGTREGCDDTAAQGERRLAKPGPGLDMPTGDYCDLTNRRPSGGTPRRVGTFIVTSSGTRASPP